jgi:hypothetical protein
MGYDIWRDEEGSKIEGPMSMTGNTLDAMTAAVEKSYMMIIFVSPECKESTNCRIEGLYGFKRAASKGLKFAYVMMNQNFTTGSRPVSVDGWLAGMIGAEIWYPLWNKNQLESTVNAIGNKIGNCARVVDKSPLSLQSPSSSSRTPISSVTSPSSISTCDMVRTLCLRKMDDDADFVTAFQCLQKNKSVCVATFDSLLTSLNITDSEDLKYPEMHILLTLSGVLKPRFREAFLKSLKL